MLGLLGEKTDKPNAVLANILNIKTPDKDNKFALLLKSFSFAKDGNKDIIKNLSSSKSNLKIDSKQENNSLKKLEPLIRLNSKTKGENEPKEISLLQLLSTDKKGAGDEKNINPDILKLIPTKDFKTDILKLINEAKNYLKEQILQKKDIKELPKTISGLIKLAKKSGIDVLSIKLDSLPKSAIKNKLIQASSLDKPLPLKQNALPHSTNELVKSEFSEKIESSSLKPLNLLLMKKEDNQTKNNLSKDETKETKTTKITPFTASLDTILKDDNKTDSTDNKKEYKVDNDSKGSEKPQPLNLSKTEHLTQKITEAKQLVQHVAQNIKDSVENYKPPFTRVKMQLNPQKFGEMEVTLVHRNNNIHININANSNALTAMMQNAHELRAQLSAHGLGDASMNFFSKQQQQQQQENARSNYKENQEFEDELNAEIATSLEIVLPRYI